VIDPVQSVKGKVVIDAFRMIPGASNMMMMANTEPRQTTSNIGFLKKPTIQARIHGLDRYYYSLVIDWRKNDLEEQVIHQSLMMMMFFVYNVELTYGEVSSHNWSTR
jgi:26S proteasome regulatory subunit N11